MTDFAIRSLDPQSIRLLGPTAASGPSPQARGTSGETEAVLQQFQNVLWTEVVKSMRASVPKSGLFGEDVGRDFFEDFLDEEHVRSLGENAGGLGLTEALRTQLGLPAPGAAAAPVPAPAVPPLSIAIPGEDSPATRLQDAGHSTGKERAV